MDRIVLNESMGKFMLRLFLITHILLTMKLPTNYLLLYSELGTRLVFVLLIISLAFYDILSCVLAGVILIFNNIEYMERIKLENFV
jgi:small-conductance mechanosensitive channel